MKSILLLMRDPDREHFPAQLWHSFSFLLSPCPLLPQREQIRLLLSLGGTAGGFRGHRNSPTKTGGRLIHFMQSRGNPRSPWQVSMKIMCMVATASGRSQGCTNLRPAFLRVLKYQEEQITHLVTWAWLRTIGLCKHYERCRKRWEGGRIAQLSASWHSAGHCLHKALVPKQLIGKKAPNPNPLISTQR